MKILIVRNPSSSNSVLLSDLGLEILPGTDRVLSDELTREEISRSDDLASSVQSGDLIVLREGVELSSNEGLNYLKFCCYGFAEFEVVNELPDAERFRAVILEGHATLDTGVYVCSANTMWVQWIRM